MGELFLLLACSLGSLLPLYKLFQSKLCLPLALQITNLPSLNNQSSSIYKSCTQETYVALMNHYWQLRFSLNSTWLILCLTKQQPHNERSFSKQYFIVLITESAFYLKAPLFTSLVTLDSVFREMDRQSRKVIQSIPQLILSGDISVPIYDTETRRHWGFLTDIANYLELGGISLTTVVHCRCTVKKADLHQQKQL